MFVVLGNPVRIDYTYLLSPFQIIIHLIQSTFFTLNLTTRLI